MRILRCPEPLAEEIAQEAFLRLHIAMRDSLRVNDVRAWIFRVARNLYIDRRREDQRYRQTSRAALGMQDLTVNDPMPDPERQLLEQERLGLLARELMRLPELQRECMRLKAQGLRYHEIAAALQIPATAAVDHVRQAVKRLSARLAD